MGPVLLVKMLTEDWPKKGGTLPGEVQRPMGETFGAEDNPERMQTQIMYEGHALR